VHDHRRGLTLGFAAAVSFGLSVPLSKRLLDDVSPQLLAGLLYLGAFSILVVALIARRDTREARLRRSDLPRVVVLTTAGGLAAPVLLLVGLERVSGSTGSLLLNLEGPFTLLMAVVVFREHLGRHPALGAAAIFSGAAILSWAEPGSARDLAGVACIAAACALWALDNNLTQSLTVRDPIAVVTVKAGAAAAVNVTVGLLATARPAAGSVAGALALGALSYGLSIVLDAYALRALGAAREAAIFATAPFVERGADVLGASRRARLRRRHRHGCRCRADAHRTARARSHARTALPRPSALSRRAPPTRASARHRRDGASRAPASARRSGARASSCERPASPARAPSEWVDLIPHCIVRWPKK
jgi:drug/metabolite transporter (DMT)-like permease